MDLVEEVDALKVEGVVIGLDDIGVILKLLNIDYGNLALAVIIVDRDIGLDVFCKVFTGADFMNDEATGCLLYTSPSPRDRG